MSGVCLKVLVRCGTVVLVSASATTLVAADPVTSAEPSSPTTTNAADTVATTPEPANVRMITLAPSIVDWCSRRRDTKGFFEDHAITLNEPLVVLGSPDVNRALLTEEGDVALGSVDLLHTGLGAELPVKFIASTGEATQTIVGPAGSGEGLESLRGQTIVLGPETNPSTLIAEDIFDAELGEGGYETIKIGGGSAARVAALKAGQAHGSILQPPYDQVALEDDPELQYIDTFAAYGEYAQGIVMASASWLESNPDVAARWLAAYIEGCTWVYDPTNEAAAVSLLAETTSISETASQSTYDIFISGDFAGTALSRDAYLDPATLANYLQLVVDAGILPSGTDVAVSVDQILDNSAWEAANEMVGT